MLWKTKDDGIREHWIEKITVEKGKKKRTGDKQKPISIAFFL